MTRAARPAAALLVALAITAAGIGWLDLLRRNGALGDGPRLRESLPLQRLAGSAAQPLARVVAAWLPAGFAGGAALYFAGIGSRAVRAAVLGGLSLVLLLAAGASSDAVTASDTLRGHIATQPHRLAIWLAAGLVAAGAAVPGRLRR
jgi:hypothetical protein